MKKDDLGNRMKLYYEEPPKTRLIRRTPVIARIDGRAFHTFTRNFKRPFDDVLIEAMQKTTKYLCEKVQGCKLGYTQSDEISLLLIDYDTLDTCAFFDYEVQKMCSIIASMATRYFNKTFAEIVDKHTNLLEMHGVGTVLSADYEIYEKAKWEAEFDCRVFNLPREEVTNYFLWRQQDAVRNSIQMVGQSYFSHAQLQRKNSNQIQEMLFQEHNINWNNFPVHKKRGSCIIKKDFWLLNGKFYPIEEKLEDKTKKIRQKWILDDTMPELKGSNRNYVDKFVYLDE